jgi:hypothetical protein
MHIILSTHRSESDEAFLSGIQDFVQEVVCDLHGRGRVAFIVAHDFIQVRVRKQTGDHIPSIVDDNVDVDIVCLAL